MQEFLQDRGHLGNTQGKARVNSRSLLSRDSRRLRTTLDKKRSKASEETSLWDDTGEPEQLPKKQLGGNRLAKRRRCKSKATLSSEG